MTELDVTNSDLIDIHWQALQNGWSYAAALGVVMPCLVERECGPIHVTFEPLTTMNGTTYFDPQKQRYEVVLREAMLREGDEDYLYTLAHELTHIRKGHVKKIESFVPWVTRQKAINEHVMSRILEKRETDRETEAYMQELERETELAGRWLLFELCDKLGIRWP
jgi:hypothetical protein